MTSSSDRVLFVGTNEGLYRADDRGGEYETRLLGLADRGGIRSPTVVDFNDPQVLYAGTSRGGMFRSEDEGKTWHEINEGIVYKEIWSTAQHPRTGELLAGTGPASLFKSTNGGDRWVESEGLKALPTTKEWSFPQPPHVAHVKGLSLYAGDPSLIFGSVEEGWAVRSRDAGKTWENLRENLEFDLHYIYVMPDDPTIILATSGHGFFRSFDGGDTWERVEDGLDFRYFAPLAFHPARANVLFTAAASTPPPGWRRPEGAESAFYRSDDRGESWQRLNGGLPERLPAAPRAVASDPTDPNAFFIGMTTGSIWMTENGGESFQEILNGLPQVSSITVSHQL